MQLTSTAVRKAVDQFSALRDIEWRRRDRRADKEREGLVRARREEREWVGDLPREWPAVREGEEDEAERCVVVVVVLRGVRELISSWRAGTGSC